MGDIYNNPPQSRNEAILRATIDGTEYEAPPQSRIEDLLIELKAAIEQGACTGNYNDLNNKPQINGVALQGDKSISDLFDGKVDIGVGTVEESGYAELKDENGNRIFRASSANGGASVESGALIGQSGALVLYNGEGGLGSISPKGGARLVDVDLPAENGTLVLDSQIASSQTPAKAAVVTVTDAAPINAEDITVDITPKQDLHGYDRPWAGGAGKNKFTGWFSSQTLTLIEGTDYTNTALAELLGDDKTYAPTGVSYITFGAYLTAGTYCLKNLTDGAYVSFNRIAIAGTKCAGSTISIRDNGYTFISAVDGWNWFSIERDRGVSDPTDIPFDGTELHFIIYSNNETVTEWTPYSNICPIEGWTGAELDRVGKNWFDKAYSGAVLDGFISDSGIITTSTSGEKAFVCEIKKGTYTITKPLTARYRVGTTIDYPSNGTICVDFLSGNVNREICTFTATVDGFLIIYGLNNTGETRTVQDLLNGIQLEIGNQPTSYEPYQGQQYTQSFGETVYGGKWHVTEGGTDKTHANIDNYNGETINEPWLSSMDEYVAGATPTTGAQVVYPLTTPTTISTPKQNVPMLKGINTVYADCGDTSLKYQPDNVIGELKGMIQALDARVTAPEEA